MVLTCSHTGWINFSGLISVPFVMMMNEAEVGRDLIMAVVRVASDMFCNSSYV